VRRVGDGRVRVVERDGDDDDRKRGDRAEDQGAAAEPLEQRRQRQFRLLEGDKRRVTSKTPFPIRLDACAALGAENKAYFFEFFQIRQSYLTSRQDRSRTPA
jgi:hypothetical protein